MKWLDRLRRLVPAWPVRVAMVALALLTFPYVVLWLAAPRGGAYSGLIFTPSDGYLYMAQIFHGHFGAWTFVDYFSWRHLPATPVYWLYSLIGHLLVFDPTPQVLALAFHLTRLTLAGVFMWQLWRFLSEFTTNRASRRSALVLALFGSGFGVWQTVAHFTVAGQQPFDLAEIESSSFFSMLYAPHFVLSLLAIVVFLRALPRALQAGDGMLPVVVAAGAATALTAIHPEKIALVGLSASLYLGWLLLRHEAGWKAMVRTAFIGLCAAAYPAVILVLVRANPVASGFLTQGARGNAVQDPVLYYLLGFGLSGIFTLAGLPRLVRRTLQLAPAEALLWSMVIAHIVIFAIPLTTLIHRGEGLELILSALGARYLVMDLLPRLWRSRAFAALSRVRPLGYSRRRLRELSLNLLLILSVPSTLGLALAVPRAAIAQDTDIYLSHDDLAALAWIRGHSSNADVAVGAPESDEYIAAYSGVHAVLGHFSATPQLTSELRDLAVLYRAPSLDSHYLHLRNVRWLWFGPREDALRHFDPDRSAVLNKRFQSGTTRVYEVLPAPGQLEMTWPAT